MKWRGTFEIFWGDLSPKCQNELRAFLDDDEKSDDVPRNWDIFPIATLEGGFLMLFRCICLFLFLGGLGAGLLIVQELSRFHGFREIVEGLLEGSRLYDEDDE